MRTQKCPHCKDNYIFDENGPIKECSCGKIEEQRKAKEAAERYAKAVYGYEFEHVYKSHISTFLAGVRWAQEKNRS